MGKREQTEDRCRIRLESENQALRIQVETLQADMSRQDDRVREAQVEAEKLRAAAPPDRAIVIKVGDILSTCEYLAKKVVGATPRGRLMDMIYRSPTYIAAQRAMNELSEASATAPAGSCEPKKPSLGVSVKPRLGRSTPESRGKNKRPVVAAFPLDTGRRECYPSGS